MAAELELIRCQGCGAGVGVDPSAAHVTCGFCAQSTPATGLARHVALPARASAAEEEGLLALREALTEKYKPGALAVVAIFTLGPAAMVLIAASWVQVGLALEVPKTFGTLVMLGLVVLSILVFTVFLLWFYMRTDPRIAASMNEVHQSIVREPVPGKCPGCGAPLWVPSLSASLACCFCRAPLLASEGMLIRWVDDAQQRRAAWSSEANELLRKVRFQQKVAGCLSPVVWLLATFVVVFALAGAIMVLRLALGL